MTALEAKKELKKNKNIAHVLFRFFVGENSSDGGKQDLGRKEAIKELNDDIGWDGYEFEKPYMLTEKCMVLNYRIRDMR